MKNECCGKVVRTPYCPICGNKTDGPESLLAYLQEELKAANTNKARILHRLDESSKFYRAVHRKRNESKLTTCEAKIERIKGWIEFVQRATK
jgi:hypothetical protein